ncbi:MAG: OsmC family protein [Planctomycetes bacterium]|nr:OsmC family protein [Planctomycetota bacterium]
MHVFETEVVWQRDERKACRVRAGEKPALTVATPPEFGGPEGVWSPEELFVGSVGSCLLSTFLYFAERFQLPFGSYTSTSRGTVEQRPEGLRFTGLDVSIVLQVPDGKALEKAVALRLKEKLEKYCPVSASLACPVRLTFEVTLEGAA